MTQFSFLSAFFAFSKAHQFCERVSTASRKLLITALAPKAVTELLASDSSAILPISSLSSAVRGYPWCRVLIMRTCWRCFDEVALLVYACMCVPVGVPEVVGVCVCVCSPSSLVDPLFPRKLTWLGKQKLHSYWPTSHWCINLIGWHVLLPHTCKECALWVQLERNGNILWSILKGSLFNLILHLEAYLPKVVICNR